MTAMAKQKYYVVWEGREPGIYDNWEDCQDQIDGYPNAKYKSFKTREEATAAYREAESARTGTLLEEIAFRNSSATATGKGSSVATGMGSTASATARASDRATTNPQVAAPRPVIVRDYSGIPEINLNAIAVDGACSGNPGMMEYRGVRVADGQEIFHVGPLADGTNNVAEYLALIHALSLLFRQNDSTTPIYTDSINAVAWVRNRGCRTKLQPTEANRRIFEMLARANIWIQSHTPRNPILKWNTALWGEIPADFARK